MMIKSRLTAAAAALPFLLTLPASPATAVSPVTKTAGGELLVAADGRNFVQRSDGQRVELPLSRAARISDFRSAGDHWLVAAVNRASDGEAHRLELLQGRGSEVTALPSPALEPAAELMQPAFIADRQRVQALVWLEGAAHDQLAVKVSRWLAGGWSAPETLSPPGKGTQIAPTTAVLDDGSWLVAWAAFDGQDDEILWSRFSDGAWSSPAGIAADNAVPDITPHLFATEGGALAAWSRFDGNDYRINVARFDGERWSPPTVAGPAGSTDPAFSEAAEPYLVYHHADPPGWAVIQLDAEGNVLREASLEVRAPGRPMLAEVSEQAVRFEWTSAEKQLLSSPLPWTER